MQRQPQALIFRTSWKKDGKLKKHNSGRKLRVWFSLVSTICFLVVAKDYSWYCISI